VGLSSSPVHLHRSSVQFISASHISEFVMRQGDYLLHWSRSSAPAMPMHAPKMQPKINMLNGSMFAVVVLCSAMFAKCLQTVFADGSLVVALAVFPLSTQSAHLHLSLPLMLSMSACSPECLTPSSSALSSPVLGLPASLSFACCK